MQEDGHVTGDADFARRLQDDLGDPFDCGLCLETISAENAFVVPGCDHKVCRGCASLHIYSEMMQQQVPIRCPICLSEHATNPHLDITEIDATTAETVLTEEQALQLEKTQLRAGLLRVPGIHQCTQPDCPGAAEMMGQVRYDCPVCNHRYCVSCKVDWHDGSTCEQHQQWQVENSKGDDEIEKLAKQSGWKRCPACTTLVDKFEGCSHVVSWLR